MASKSKAPATPDYLGAAIAQGQLSKESALTQTGLNRPNEVTPYGTRTWTYNGGGRANAGSGGTGSPNQQPQIPSTGNTSQATGKRPTYREYLAQGGSKGVAAAKLEKLVDQSNASIINPGDWTVTTKLSPEQQAILDQSNEYKMLSGGMAKDRLSQFGYQGGINFSNPNVRKSNAQTTQLDKFSANPVNVDPTAMGRFEGSPVGLNELGYTQDSFANQRQSVEDAVFNRSKRMLDPTYSQQEQAMRSRLANQGLAEGSEAYKTEMENFNRDRSNAYQATADSAVLAGGQEQSRLVSDLLSTRNQDLQNQLSRFDTGLKTADFNNQASQTDFSNKLQSGLAGFSTGLQANQANNQTAQNQFQQGLAANQANSQYDLQLMQALLGARGQALNEAQALNSGTTVSQPQFGGYGGAAGADPANIMGAVQGQYNALLGGVNAENAAAANTNTGLATIFSAAIMAY